jgi:tyrosine-protein phosphatase SIW14
MKTYIIIVTIAFSILANAQQLPVPEIIQPISNRQKLDDKLYRSGQPQKGEFELLAAAGINTSLNLRNRFRDNPKAKGSNVNLERIPINAFRMKYKHVVKALSIIEKSDGAVLVHCKHGSDRTGVVSAAYRIVYQDWNKDAAIEEFLRPELGYHRKWFPNLKKLLETIDYDQLKVDVKNHK